MQQTKHYLFVIYKLVRYILYRLSDILHAILISNHIIYIYLDT